jgi:hypothetical protein
MKINFSQIKYFLINQWKAVVFALINIFLFTLPFLWAGQNVYKIGGDDSRLYLYAPWEWIKNIALYSWYSGFPGGFGTYNPQFFYLPFNFAAGLIKSILPFLNHERVIYGLVLIISFISIYFIVEEFIQDKKSWQSFLGKTLGGMVYALSPLIASNYWINPPSYFFVIILYPLLVLFFLRALSQKRVVPLIYGAIASFILSMSFFNPPLLIPFIIGFGLFLILYFLLIETNKLRFLKYLLIYGVLIFLINSFFIIPYAHSILSGNSFAKSAFSSDVKDDFVNSGVLSSLVSSQQLINHLSGNPSANNFNWISNSFGTYFNYVFYVAYLNLILLFVVFFVFLLRPKDLESEKKWLYVFSFIILILVFLQTINIGNWGQELFGWLVLHIPGFISLRWFFIKTPPTYVLFYSAGIGLAFYILLKNLKRKIILVPVLIIVFLIVIVQALPFIAGYAFNLPIYKQLNWNVELPKSYLDLISYMKDLREDNRTITFPLVVGSWTMVQSADPGGIYIGNSPLKALADKNEFNSLLSFLNPFNPSFSGSVYYSIINQDYYALKKILGMLNTRYAVYNYGLLDKQEADYDFIKETYLWFWRTRGYKEKYQAMLDNIGEKVKDFDGFQVYKIDDNFFLPHIYAPQNISYFDGDIDRLVDILSFPQYVQNNAMFYQGLASSEESKQFALDHSSSAWIMPYNNPKELQDIYRKMQWVYDPGTLGTYLGQLEIYKKALDLDDYVLKIPREGSYQIFLRTNSVIANNIKNGSKLCFDARCLENINKNEKQVSNQYEMIGKLTLSAGEHTIKIKNSKEKINILAAGDLILYNFDNDKNIDSPQVEFKRINSIKYAVRVKGSKESFPLVFNESFHDGWKVYLRNESDSLGTNDYQDEEIIGSIQNQGLLSGQFYENIFKQSIAEDKHFLVNLYSNAWWIDPQNIKSYKENSDGSIDFDLVIEFAPQRLFYVSAGISGLTLLFCILYLIYAGRHRRSK